MMTASIRVRATRHMPWNDGQTVGCVLQGTKGTLMHMNKPKTDQRGYTCAVNWDYVALSIEDGNDGALPDWEDLDVPLDAIEFVCGDGEEEPE